MVEQLDLDLKCMSFESSHFLSKKECEERKDHIRRLKFLKVGSTHYLGQPFSLFL